MMDITRLLNNDISELSEEEQVKAEEFTNKLKENIINELINNEVEGLIQKLCKDKEDFRDEIERMLVHGVKGFKSMNMQLLITMYIEKMGNESLIELIQNI